MTSANALLKYDFAKGTTDLHTHGPGRIGGEGVFVSRPDPQTEDDGWVITYVHDEQLNRSELIIVAARDFSARPIARIQIPVRVPYGFHGAWIPGKMMATRK